MTTHLLSPPLACRCHPSSSSIHASFASHVRRRATPYLKQQSDCTELVSNPTTDFDHFPYRRWFRGEYDSDEPVVHERHAGWHPRSDHLYSNSWMTDTGPIGAYDLYPEHVFQESYLTRWIPRTPVEKYLRCDPPFHYPIAP